MNDYVTWLREKRRSEWWNRWTTGNESSHISSSTWKETHLPPPVFQVCSREVSGWSSRNSISSDHPDSSILELGGCCKTGDLLHSFIPQAKNNYILAFLWKNITFSYHGNFRAIYPPPPKMPPSTHARRLEHQPYQLQVVGSGSMYHEHRNGRTGKRKDGCSGLVSEKRLKDVQMLKVPLF